MCETRLVRGDDDRCVTAVHTRWVIARVAHLFHYPVKGLAGVELAATDLTPGRGFPHDRAVAISNGSRPVPADGAWASPSALYGLARNPGLTRLALRIGDGPGTPVTVTAPDGTSFVVHLDRTDGSAAELEVASARVVGLVAPGQWGPPGVVRARTPLWQRPGAAVSIVNLATLRLLGRVWSTPLDLRRFRANVYVDGLEAWEELDLVGHRVHLGGAELEVVGPLERGRGIGVDPDDGSTLFDVAALLAVGVGHRYVGVDARVVGGGRVRRGDPMTVAVAPTRPRALGTSAADPVTDWPRRTEVVRVEHESPTVLSLWLRDPLGLAAGVRQGQHVRLHTLGPEGPVWRKYTVSAVEAGLVRISVALEKRGRMSEILRITPPEDLRILLTGPFGAVSVDPEGTDPVLLLSAGIGVTPTVALLRELVTRSPTRPVGVLHVARGPAPALWDELTTLLERRPGATHDRVSLHLTGADPPRGRELAARGGRPVAADVARLVEAMPADRLVALVCGPDSFRAEVRVALRAAGVPDGSILLEAFFSPPPERVHVPPVSDGPFRVRFSVSGQEAVWRQEAGSLLDLAESCGLAPPVDCREAACNICATKVTTGSTSYTTPPMGPPPGEVLICCAVPTSDVTVEL